MTYALRLHSKIRDDFDAVPLAMHPRIMDAIHSLADNPRPPGMTKLVGIKRGVDNAYRIRVGNYRVGYRIFDRELLVSVVAVAKRGDIYPILKRRLR